MRFWRYGYSIERLGQRYRLEGVLGSGGMAEVYLAWDEQDEREVAIKVLKSDDLDQETLNRFVKEAAQIVDWQHPHILRIYEQMQIELIDVARGSVLFYMVMEYASGGDLQKRLTPGQPFPLSASFALFRQLCDAVAYAHEHGVIHRDLKPLNILFRRPLVGPEEVVLSDFGLAVQVDASHQTFARGGTLPYMAPEQFQGQAQPASDIFALGVILYQLCTGRLPFRRSIQDLVRVDEAPTPTRPSLLNPDLPPGLDEPILRALQEMPTERYRDAHEFWDTTHLGLLSNARTFPFLTDESWSQAGTTWPFGATGSSGSRQSGKSMAQRTSRPNPSGPGPIEERSQSSPGSLREKQKASPERSFGLSLPAYSIPDAPNPSLREATERGEARIVQPGERTSRRDAATTRRRVLPETARSQFGKTRQLASHTFARIQREESADSDASTFSALEDNELAATSRTGHASAARQPLSTPQLRASRPRGRGWPLVPALTTLALIVLVIAIVLASSAQGRLLQLFGAPTLTVTLTPQSRLEQATYALSALPGTSTDVTHRQVAARVLTADSPTQSSTVPTSGNIAATTARGQLTFINNGSTPITIGSTTITDKNGIQVSFQGTVIVPAVPPSTAVVAGFAVNPGASGNIPVLDIVQSCCAPNIVVKNTTAFTGGQDAVPNSVVQQSDIDGATRGLEGQLTGSAQGTLTSQVRSSEHVVNGSMNCTPTIAANHRPGEQAKSVTVQVSVTCSAEVYDARAMGQMAATLLSEQAASDPSLGGAYQEVGPPAISLLSAVPRGSQGAVALTVQARGRWAYHFNATRLRQLATLIAGKSASEARSFLLQQAGITAVAFKPSGNVPGNVDEIRMVVAASG